jgi:transcriptional regulator with XRE-family HTH domain
MSSIGERVRKIRTELKLSQQKFGEKLKVSKSHISNIELGGDYPSDMLIKLLGIEYGINEEWLKYGTGERNVNAEVDEGKTIQNIDDYAKQIYDNHQKYLRLIALLAPDAAKNGKIPFEEEPDLMNMISYLHYCFSRAAGDRDKLRIVIKFENAFSDYLDVIEKLNSDSAPYQQEMFNQISQIVNYNEIAKKSSKTRKNEAKD